MEDREIYKIKRNTGNKIEAKMINIIITSDNSDKVQDLIVGLMKVKAIDAMDGEMLLNCCSLI